MAAFARGVGRFVPLGVWRGAGNIVTDTDADAIEQSKAYQWGVVITAQV